MSEHLNLTIYERSLISNGIQIIMKESSDKSMNAELKEDAAKHEKDSIELFTLRSKVSIPDMMDFSFQDLTSMKEGLKKEEEFTHEKSLEDGEKDKTKFYRNCKLQTTELREKIDAIAQYKKDVAEFEQYKKDMAQ